MTGDGHGHRGFSCRPFGYQELALGFPRLMAERLIPERPTTVAETWDLRMNHDRSMYSGLRFPFEWLNRFGWQVADAGGGWREDTELKGRPDS